MFLLITLTKAQQEVGGVEVQEEDLGEQEDAAIDFPEEPVFHIESFGTLSASDCRKGD